LEGRPISLSDLKQEVVMTAIIHALSRPFRSAKETDCLKQIALFCGAGLLVTLLLLTYGVDLSPGLF
jgi:ribose/xylose/arabinose/galactoside ABC-type transport system permease subunit